MGGIMEFCSIGEEKWFQYDDEKISKEEAGVIRYLLTETEIFKNGKVKALSLGEPPKYIKDGCCNSKPKKYIYGNGLFWDKDGCNQDFEAFIHRQKNGYVMFVDSEEIISKKRRKNIEVFIFDKEDIKVISVTEDEKKIKTIPYWEENLKRV